MIIIPAILAGIFFFRARELKGFSLYIFTATLFEVAFTISGVNQTKNWWLLEIFSLVEFTIIGYWLLSVISQVQLSKVLFLLGSLDLLFILFSISKEPDDVINFLIHYYCLFILTIVGFISFFNQHMGSSMMKDSRFWILIGITLQFSCMCLIFNLNSFLRNPENRAESIYFSYLLSSANIVSYTLYSIGYLCFNFPKRSRLF